MRGIYVYIKHNINYFHIFVASIRDSHPGGAGSEW